MTIEGLKQLDANDYFEITISEANIKVDGGSSFEKVGASKTFSESLQGCSDNEVTRRVIDYYLENSRVLGIRYRNDHNFIVEGPLKYDYSYGGNGVLFQRCKELRIERALDSASIKRILEKYEFDRESTFLTSLDAFCNYQFFVTNTRDSYYRYSKDDDTMYFFMSEDFKGKMAKLDNDFFFKAAGCIFREKNVNGCFKDLNGSTTFVFDDGSQVLFSSRFTNKALTAYSAAKKDKKDLAKLDARQMMITEDGGSK